MALAERCLRDLLYSTPHPGRDALRLRSLDTFSFYIGSELKIYIEPSLQG
jgi:hypothetical protein